MVFNPRWVFRRILARYDRFFILSLPSAVARLSVVISRLYLGCLSRSCFYFETKRIMKVSFNSIFIEVSTCRAAAQIRIIVFKSKNPNYHFKLRYISCSTLVRFRVRVWVSFSTKNTKFVMTARHIVSPTVNRKQ